jgi:hypothetical protein
VNDNEGSDWSEMVMAAGCIAAVLWGVGVSLRAFFLGPLAIDWTEWAIQFVAGIVVCLFVARITLLVADWHRKRARLAAVRLETPRP